MLVFSCKSHEQCKNILTFSQISGYIIIYMKAGTMPSLQAPQIDILPRLRGTITSTLDLEYSTEESER